MGRYKIRHFFFGVGCASKFDTASEFELISNQFDASVLSEFCTRLVQGSADLQFLEGMMTRFKEKGLLKTRGRERMDSTNVLLVARAPNRLESVGETLCNNGAQVVGQTAIAAKNNEITAVQVLLTWRDLKDTVLTMEALLTRRSLVAQILDQRGHYFIVVKANQPDVYDAIEFLFQNPPWTKQEQAQEYWKYTTTNQGHGRREERTLESSTALAGHLNWS